MVLNQHKAVPINFDGNGLVKGLCAFDKGFICQKRRRSGQVTPIHTFYLSETPQTCLCKNFLSGVNFSRLSEKTHIFDFFRDIFSVFGAFSLFFGCKIWFSKIQSV